ncbi:hypothetical protein M0L20_17000 [Spirosoma sp. RP8]|uniref:Uncharacterized protein n=1 Tax=Spirosoma liriopis TaxID=2937440 RepID=A0ABT0HNX4_9BACT|nr:hypothetical protein [Spirosoma liriopis]MCK8493567.1 hypothetical protein [Spirosoma liriopis]
MPDRYLYQKKALLESQIIAGEMVLADLYERKARTLEANQFDSCFSLALAINAQIQNEHLANVVLEAERQHIVNQIESR